MKTFGFRATLVFSLMLITSTASCSYLTKAEYAREEIVRESNRAISVLEVFQSTAEVAYEAEQRAVVVQAVQEKTTEAEVVARVKRVRDRWAPLWVKFDQLRELNKVLKLTLDQSLNATEVPKALKMIEQFAQAQRETAELFSTLKGTKK